MSKEQSKSSMEDTFNLLKKHSLQDFCFFLNYVLKERKSNIEDNKLEQLLAHKNLVGDFKLMFVPFEITFGRRQDQ